MATDFKPFVIPLGNNSSLVRERVDHMREAHREKYPAQVRHLLFDQSEIRSEALIGFEEGWTMPVGFWRARNGFDASYRSHPHASLSFVRAGAPVQRMDGRFAGREGGLHPDSFMLYPGGEPRRYIARGDVRLCHLYFAPFLIREVHERETGFSADIELCDDRVLTLDAKLRRMTDEYVSRALDSDLKPSRLEMDTRGLLLALHLLQNHSSRAGPAQPGRGRSLGQWQLRTVLEYMEAHLDQDLPLRALGETVGLSPHYLCSAFKASTGLAPHQYVIRLRVERAKELLLGDNSLGDVALSCGFSSQQHFSATYRRLTGVTPGAWRRAFQSR